MTDRPKLYPGHRHQWAASDPAADLNSVDPPEDDDGDPIIGAKPPMVRCTVCGFQAPRNAAGLDGRMPEAWSDAYGQGRDDEAAGLPLRDNPHDSQPEQESEPA